MPQKIMRHVYISTTKVGVIDHPGSNHNGHHHDGSDDDKAVGTPAQHSTRLRIYPALLLGLQLTDISFSYDGLFLNLYLMI